MGLSKPLIPPGGWRVCVRRTAPPSRRLRACGRVIVQPCPKGSTFLRTNVNIRPRRGGWGNRVSPRPRPAGGWGNRVSPYPHPRAGVGGRSPPRNNRMCIAALGAMRMTVSREHRLPEQGYRATGLPHPLPPGGGMGQPGFSVRLLEGQALPRAGAWGNLVPPCSR